MIVWQTRADDQGREHEVVCRPVDQCHGLLEPGCPAPHPAAAAHPSWPA